MKANNRGSFGQGEGAAQASAMKGTLTPVISPITRSTVPIESGWGRGSEVAVLWCVPCRGVSRCWTGMAGWLWELADQFRERWCGRARRLAHCTAHTRTARRRSHEQG